MATLLVIDNYDSFTYNLIQMFMAFDLIIIVRRSDKVSLTQIDKLAPDYILISPGPRDPAHAGVSIALIRAFYQKYPILGVCLGMQCLNEAFGGGTKKAPTPMHGKVSPIHHNGKGLYKGMPKAFTAARYHSLIVAPRADSLIVTARSPEGVIMGLSHPHWPLHGVQFHPESFLTEKGDQLIKNFLRLGTLDLKTPPKRRQGALGNAPPIISTAPMLSQSLRPMPISLETHVS